MYRKNLHFRTEKERKYLKHKGLQYYQDLTIVYYYRVFLLEYSKTYLLSYFTALRMPKYDWYIEIKIAWCRYS